MFDKDLHKKRALDEAWNVVNQYGCTFLQFPTFAYLRIRCFDGEPFMLPRYPSDIIIFMEMA